MTESLKWRPLGPVLRRVAGVLVEKAKTTPDIYPMTVNAIVTASNQKSNRHPQMELTADDVEEALTELRRMGAVVEIQGDGRKYKYKHLLYDWLQVDKAELAVLAELLLRGHQTMGDLRARASRMEKIDGLPQLKPIVDSLIAKNLMIPLTPEGRGQIVSHNLYLPEELAALEKSVETGGVAASTSLGRQFSPTGGPPEIDALSERIRELEEQFRQMQRLIAQLEIEIQSQHVRG
jgi:hypothetical protein